MIIKIVRFLIAVVMLMTGLASSAAAQDRKFKSAQAFYESAEGKAQIRDLPTAVSSSSVSAGSVSIQGAGPGTVGAGEPYFIPIMDTFVRVGDRVRAKLRVVRDVPANTSLGGRVFYPGPSGAFDSQGRVAFFQGSFNNGFFPFGLTSGQVVEVYSAEINSEYTVGEHQFDLLLWDQSGTLLQQTFHSFHVVTAGPFGLNILRVDKAEINDALDGVVLTGVFPQGQEIRAVVGIAGFADFVTTGVSKNGRILRLQGMIFFGQTTAADVTVLVPEYRLGTTLNKGLIIPGGLAPK